MDKLTVPMLCLLSIALPADAAEVATPVVPLSIMAAASAPMSTSTVSAVASTTRRPLRVSAEPGVNQVLVVAVGHVNRIVTPFERPQVRTASSAEVTVVKNILYVVPADDTPVTLFVTPKGDEDMALSLTLAPRKIPPVEITLDVAKRFGRRRANAKAEKWETAQPYVETLTQLLRALAHEEIPDGFEIDRSSGNPISRLCRQAGVRYTTGQVIKGRNLMVLVGVAESTLSRPIELNERACSTDGVRAVAGWPAIALFPGKPIELYVAVEQQQFNQTRRERPSLLRRPR